MSRARDRIHIKYCPDIGACEQIGGAGSRDKCKNLDYLLDQVEDDRVHTVAEELRAQTKQYTEDIKRLTGLERAFHVQMTATILMTANKIDPYEERDGQLVRKSDGKKIVGLKPGERHG